MASQNILITGANRGLGFNLVKALVLRPNTTIIAAVRDVAKSTPALTALPVGSGSKIVIVKIDSSKPADPAAAAKEVQTTHQITHLDILFANAGIFLEDKPAISTDTETLREYLEVNTLAPLLLLQAFKPLLDASSSPRFFVMSTILGSIGLASNFQAMPVFGYGLSKSALNFLVRRVAIENPKLIVMAFHPGWVQTDMGNSGAQGAGMKEAPMTIEHSIKGLLRMMDGASLEQSGSFMGVEEGVMPW